MRLCVSVLVAGVCAALVGCVSGQSALDLLVPGFRPPSIPIIVLSPTISMWLNRDKLTDDYITHWSGPTMAMTGLVSVDSTVLRFLGPQPDTAPAMTQSNLFVTPTQTLAVFNGGGIQLNLTFSQAALPHDMADYSRPYAYITVDVGVTDGKSHSVQVYMDHAGDVVANNDHQLVDWMDVSASMAATAAPAARVLRMGGYDQIPFSNRGDGTRNEWGHLFFATNSKRVKTAVQCYINDARANFAAGQPLPGTDMRKPREAGDQWPGSAFVLDFGSVTGGAVASDFFVFAFDDVYTMFYFHEYHRPLWRHLHDGVQDMLAAAFHDYAAVRSRCNAFDLSSLQQLTAAGGQRYATYSALAHRQATGATVTVWNEARGEVWGYMKEISSDGDVSTVDVIYPASPFFVLYGPELLKRTLLPVLAYGQNETDVQYRLPWAPHHLGAWPVSDIIGEQQEQMPMEESANLLIMLAAIAQQQKNDVAYLKPYWPALTQWANYLNVSLPDPGEQLCTDDFEGPSPHNANLGLSHTTHNCYTCTLSRRTTSHAPLPSPLHCPAVLRSSERHPRSGSLRSAAELQWSDGDVCGLLGVCAGLRAAVAEDGHRRLRRPLQTAVQPQKHLVTHNTHTHVHCQRPARTTQHPLTLCPLFSALLSCRVSLVSLLLPPPLRPLFSGADGSPSSPSRVVVQSTKYNLMWQYALKMDLFPQSVADMEVAWYLSHANKFGVPLDSRSAMVKCDWLSWAAAFATKQSDAETLLDYVYTFADQTPSRSPFSDWYNSSDEHSTIYCTRGHICCTAASHPVSPPSVLVSRSERPIA